MGPAVASFGAISSSDARGRSPAVVVVAWGRPCRDRGLPPGWQRWAAVCHRDPTQLGTPSLFAAPRQTGWRSCGVGVEVPRSGLPQGFSAAGQESKPCASCARWQRHRAAAWRAVGPALARSHVLLPALAWPCVLSCTASHALACPFLHVHAPACPFLHMCAFARSGMLPHVLAHTCVLLHAPTHSCMSLLMHVSSCMLHHNPACPCSRMHALAHSCRSLLTCACFCMLPHVLARSGTLLRGSQLPSQGHACVAAIRVRRWAPALIKLSYPLAAQEVPWGLGGWGLSWLTGTRRVWGHPGFPPAAPCTRGLGFLAAPGCWGGPGWGPGHGDPPTTSPAPHTLRGPQQPPPAQPSHRQLLAGIFRYRPCPICVSNVPGGERSPPPAAVARFLPRVPANPLHGAGVGVGASSTHFLQGHPTVGTMSLGTWPRMPGGQAGPG